MAEKRFDANYTFKFNSVPFQNLFSPNQLTVNNWNNIVNQLAIQSNNSSRYLKELDTWLFGSGHISYTPENFEGFLQHLVTRITDNLNKINSNISSIDDIVNTLNNTLETIGDLDKLNTFNKNTIVSALNELHSTKVEKVDGKGLSTNDYSNEEKQKVNQAYNYSTNISNLENDNNSNKQRITILESDNTSNKQRINTLESSGFITKFVTDLVNYYNKNETLSKTEIMALINAINGIEFLVVDELPNSNIKKNAIYLKKIIEDSPNQRYEEWVYIEQEFGEWERIGTTDVNLTEYLTYNPQVLTEEQKLQVFKNLGIDEILKANAVIEINTIQDFTSDATYQSLKNLYSNVGHAAMLVLKEELEVEDSNGNRAMLWGNFHLTRISYEENIFTFSSVQISSSSIFAESIEFNVNLTEEEISSFEVKSYTQSDSRIGDLNDLNTDNKESIVDAVNEVKNNIDALPEPPSKTSDLQNDSGYVTQSDLDGITIPLQEIEDLVDELNGDVDVLLDTINGEVI